MKKKILSIVLVEDNLAHVELITRSIEDSTLKTKFFTFSNISDAGKYIRTNVPDLVITDLNLPDGKGTELISVKAGLIKYPVILMTSFGDENIAVEAMKAGALDYLVKTPLVFISMPKLIKRVLREWKNIDDKQKAQQSLLAKEIEQRELLSSIMDAVITIDENNIVLSFNSVAEKLFGYESEEIIGTSLMQLIPEKYKHRHSDGVDRYIKDATANIIHTEGGVELEGLKKDNSVFPVRLSVGELPTHNNGIKRFIGICQDLTQLKQQEEQLRRSQKMEALGKLTGGIAHDYNNMLGVVLGYAEILESMLQEQPDLKKYAQEIRHAGERGVKLTKKLLSFSRLKAADPKILDLNELLNNQKDMLAKTLTARIKLKFELESKNCIVNIDDGEFEDAIVNISINAMHAIEGAGSLTFETSTKTLSQAEAAILQLDAGEFVLLSITDTGIGMSDAVKEKIFEPFFTTKGELGTGLGLSQVYGFIERSAGAINIFSLIDVGTRITLYFPQLSEDITDKNKNDNINEALINLSGTESILIVDDEEELLKLTSSVLESRGYKVSVACDGKQALEMLAAESVDLVFSDVIMPDMDGFQLAEMIKEKYPSVKIQLASGFTDKREEAAVGNSLRENLLDKPYSSTQLLLKIRQLLN